MKGSMKRGIVLALGAVALLTGSASAETVETSGSASVDVLTNYVWRGQNLGDDGVIQPSIGITYGNFGFNYWANQDMETNEGNETDLTINYTTIAGKVALDFGYIYYALDGVEDTQEVYISAALDTFLSPSLIYYYDWDEGEGGFAVLSVGHSISLSDKAALNLGALASYNFSNEIMGYDNSGDEFSGLYNGEVTASVSYALNENISIEPKVAYSFSLSDDAEDAIKAISADGDDSIAYGGINLSLSF